MPPLSCSTDTARWPIGARERAPRPRQGAPIIAARPACAGHVRVLTGRPCSVGHCATCIAAASLRAYARNSLTSSWVCWVLGVTLRRSLLVGMGGCVRALWHLGRRYAVYAGCLARASCSCLSRRASGGHLGALAAACCGARRMCHMQKTAQHNAQSCKNHIYIKKLVKP
eukprot:scaffold5261_cov107-Isochrysis_galbana.AAC.7